MVDPRGERTDESARQIVMWRRLDTGQRGGGGGTERQTNTKLTKRFHMWGCLGWQSNSALERMLGCLADIEEGRLCGKRRLLFTSSA